MSKYLDWIREQPCAISGYYGEEVQPHHITGYNWLTGKGVGKKGSDLTAIPLRHDLHRLLHDMGHKSFEEKYNISQLEIMVKMVLKAEKEGIISL